MNFKVIKRMALVATQEHGSGELTVFIDADGAVTTSASYCGAWTPQELIDVVQRVAREAFELGRELGRVVVLQEPSR